MSSRSTSPTSCTVSFGFPRKESNSEPKYVRTVPGARMELRSVDHDQAFGVFNDRRQSETQCAGVDDLHVGAFAQQSFEMPGHVHAGPIVG